MESLPRLKKCVLGQHDIKTYEYWTPTSRGTYICAKCLRGMKTRMELRASKRKAELELSQDKGFSRKYGDVTHVKVFGHIDNSNMQNNGRRKT